MSFTWYLFGNMKTNSQGPANKYFINICKSWNKGKSRSKQAHELTRMKLAMVVKKKKSQLVNGFIKLKGVSGHAIQIVFNNTLRYVWAPLYCSVSELSHSTFFLPVSLMRAHPTQVCIILGVVQNITQNGICFNQITSCNKNNMPIM